jgi:2-oxoglutarate ferredoxin oxidoreductase subunit delta
VGHLGDLRKEHCVSEKQEAGRNEPIPFVVIEQCRGCGLCASICPNGVLAIREGYAVVARPEACAYEGLCERICPPGAIQRPFEVVVRDPAGHAQSSS